MTPAFLRCVVDPAQDGLKRSTFLPHIQLVLLDETRQLLRRKLHELRRESCHLLEVPQDVEVSLVSQVGIPVAVRQLPDADAVLGAKLFLQEVAADQDDVSDAKALCSRQQIQHVVLRHRDGAGVGEVQNQLHYVW